MTARPETPFVPSPAFSVGLEEELLLVDPDSLRLVPAAAGVLERIDAAPGAAGSEAYAAQVELRAGPAGTAAEAVESLADVRAAARRAGATMLAAGLHPTAEHGDAPLSSDERYRDVDRAVRGLIRRTPESALHVHVGMVDEQAAVDAHNGLRRALPLLQGLAANSPWWFGADSGLASARYALVRSYPGRGVPPFLRDYAGWETWMAAVTRAGGVEDYTFVWSDVRLHPRYGTVELREMDVQGPLEHVAALVALVRALAREAVEAPPRDDLPGEAIAWSQFCAARDGVDAAVLEDGSPRPLRALAEDAVERLRDLAADHGDETALEGVLELAAAGGAARQRRAHAAGGVDGLLRSLLV